MWCVSIVTIFVNSLVQCSRYFNDGYIDRAICIYPIQRMILGDILFFLLDRRFPDNCSVEFIFKPTSEQELPGKKEIK